MMTRIGFYLGKLLIRTFIKRLHLDLYTFAVSFNLHLFDHKTSKIDPYKDVYAQFEIEIRYQQFQDDDFF